MAGDFTYKVSSGIEGTKLAIEYVGDVAVGDFTKLNNLLLSRSEEQVEIHLHNLGGNFDEGLAISELVWSRGITTIVDADKVCSSACAVIFMAGREGEYEGPPSLSRRLHVKGHLGFHAPYLASTGCVGECDEPPATYRKAMIAISNLLTGATSSRWPPTLIAEMLRTKRNEEVSIKTVDQAGRWNIDLFGYAPISTFDKASANTACFNVMRWSDGDLYSHYKVSDYGNPGILKLTKKQKKRIPGATADEPARDGFVYTVSLEEMNVSGCRITSVGTSLDISLEMQGGRDEPLPKWKTKHPNTLIRSLVP